MVYGGSDGGGGPWFSESSTPATSSSDSPQDCGDTNHHAEASHMLDVALQQMDSILADTELDLASFTETGDMNGATPESHQPPREKPAPPAPVRIDPLVQAAERLKLAITVSEKLGKRLPENGLSEETRSILYSWLKQYVTNGHDQPTNHQKIHLPRITIVAAMP